MNLLLFVVTALVTSWTVTLWRVVRERQVRWGFYELRDNLRFAVIKDPQLAQTAAFESLDQSLTRYCANIADISLWTISAVAFRTKDDEAEREVAALRDELKKPRNEAMLRVYTNAIQLMVRHLRIRHPLLSTVALFMSSSSLLKGKRASLPKKVASKSKLQDMSERLIVRPVPRSSIAPHQDRAPAF